MYHQHWRIEESFKRLNGMWRPILCDNLQALTAPSPAAHAEANLADSARINQAYVHTTLKPKATRLTARKIGQTKLLQGVLSLIARETHTYKESQSKLRKPRPKPHKFMTQKGC